MRGLILIFLKIDMYYTQREYSSIIRNINIYQNIHCGSSPSGLLCENPINPCENSPCQNGASCTEVGGNPRCECQRGFIGRLCEQDLDECFQAAPCLNNGTCHNTPGSFTCACANGFSGSRCEHPPTAPEMARHAGTVEQESKQLARMAHAKEVRSQADFPQKSRQMQCS